LDIQLVVMSTDPDSGRFEDRTEAGRRLAAELVERGVEADVVLAIPRGGLPLGRAVADALDAPLDVVVASKIGAPGNPEYAIGAVGSDGSAWLDDDTIDRLGVSGSYVEREREHEATAAREKASRYRGDRSAPDLAGRSVVVVDDGVATGATAIAALRLVRERGADHVVLAVPVGPPDTVARLEAECDAVVALLTPARFGAVGAFYDRFDQVSDEEAMAYWGEQ
jgi:predicted phosphoribosyltransferase